MGAPSAKTSSTADYHQLLCILGGVEIVLDFVALDAVHWPGRTWTFGVHPHTQTLERCMLHNSICEAGFSELLNTRTIGETPTGVTVHDTMKVS